MEENSEERARALGAFVTQLYTVYCILDAFSSRFILPTCLDAKRQSL
jgi:hypothetical protein